MAEPPSSSPPHVVIAGGGVAALEALIALRELAVLAAGRSTGTRSPSAPTGHPKPCPGSWPTSRRATSIALIVTDNTTLDGVVDATEGWFEPAGGKDDLWTSRE